MKPYPQPARQPTFRNQATLNAYALPAGARYTKQFDHESRR